MNYLRYFKYYQNNSVYLQFENNLVNKFNYSNEQTYKSIIRAFFGTANKLWKDVLDFQMQK